MIHPAHNVDATASASICTIPRKLIVGLLLVGGLSVILHGLNLGMVLQHGTETGIDFTYGPDTGSYLRNATVLRDGGHFNPMYQERVLVPLLLRLGDACGWGSQSFLWLVVLFEMLGAFALGCFVYLLTKRSWLAIVGAFLYALYPGSYRFGVLVETDVLHTHLTIAAVTALAFVLTQPYRRSLYIAAGILWPLVHLTRPTLFGMAGLMPIFLWRGLLDRSSRRWCIWVCVMTAVVPLSWTVSNIVRFGIPSPSLCQAEMLHTWTVPRLKALIQNEEEPGRITLMFDEEVARVREQENWQQLHGHMPTLDGFKPSYLAVLDEAKTFLRQNIPTLMTSARWELWHQFEAHQSYHHTYTGGRVLAELYPSWLERSRSVLQVGFILGVLGLASVLGGRSRYTALLFLVILGMVFLPGSLSCFAGPRYRMLTDLLLIPFVAVAATQGMAWGALAIIVTIGYLPHRVLGWPAWFFWLVRFLTLSAFSVRIFLANFCHSHGRRPSTSDQNPP